MDNDPMTRTRVAELFKEHWLSRPSPTEAQCHDLAGWISTIRNADPSYKKNFQQRNIQLRKDRSVIEAMKRLIKKRQAALDELLRLNNLADCCVSERDSLEAVEAAIDKAMPTLLPSDPLAGQRDNASWHKAASVIADEVESALLQAGNGGEEFSFAKGGPLVRIVAGCLKLAGINKEETTIAAVLLARPLTSRPDGRRGKKMMKLSPLSLSATIPAPRPRGNAPDGGGSAS
jgi:hypothetical protein